MVDCCYATFVMQFAHIFFGLQVAVRGLVEDTTPV